jgi:hypothetical protein
MTLLHEAVLAKKNDVRMVERNVNRGVTSQADVDSYVKSLPDDAANAEWIAIDTLAGDESGADTSTH